MVGPAGAGLEASPVRNAETPIAGLVQAITTPRTGSGDSLLAFARK